MSPLSSGLWDTGRTVLIAALAAVSAACRAAPTGGSAIEILTITTLARRVAYTSESQVQSPHFSPDGSSLYFNCDGRILRLGLAGSGPPVPIDTGFAVHCNNDHGISPDGTQLVISDATEKGKSLMYLLPIAGGTPRRVQVGEPAYWHGWSPDGTTLVYCAARGGNYDVYTIPANGGQETRLTTAPGNDNGPDYSADGHWIYFHTERTGRMQIWRMHADGSGQEPVTRDDFYDWFPHPSPDGRWIAYLASRETPKTGHPPDGEYILRLMPTAGGPTRDVARFFGGNGSFNVPCWSRDGASLAFASFGNTR